MVDIKRIYELLDSVDKECNAIGIELVKLNYPDWYKYLEFKSLRSLDYNIYNGINKEPVLIGGLERRKVTSTFNPIVDIIIK